MPAPELTAPLIASVTAIIGGSVAFCPASSMVSVICCSMRASGSA
jgi:hypothetical protein